MMQAVLELEGLTLRAGSRTLVRELALRVEAGQRWALLGRNGAGKSTLLRCLAGLRPADAGTIQLGGRGLDTWDAAQLAGQRGLLPAQPADRFSIDVLESVQLVQPRLDLAAALAALEQVDAAALSSADLLQLSAGERQRVGLAQVLAQQAELLLLDEPVSFQDPAHQRRLGVVLAARQQGAQLIVAHDLNWVARVATHALGLLEDGAWLAGPLDRMLQPEPLRRIYRCDWVRLDGPDGAYWIAR